MSGGKHTLSGPGKPDRAYGSEPNTGSSWLSGVLGCLGQIILVVILTLFVILAAPSPNPAPTAPSEPVPRTAGFYATDENGKPIILEITGGSYELTYLSANAANLASLGENAGRYFFLDFSTGEHLGSPSADTYILAGSPTLRVGRIGGDAASEAEIVVSGDTAISSRFKYSAPPTGPPGASTPGRVVKKILVIGGLSEIHMEGFADQSTNRIHVLELDPPSDEWRRYDVDRRAHEESLRRYEYENRGRAGYEHPRGR
jgi:hypothetical protein